MAHKSLRFVENGMITEGLQLEKVLGKMFPKFWTYWHMLQNKIMDF